MSENKKTETEAKEDLTDSKHQKADKETPSDAESSENSLKVSSNKSEADEKEEVVEEPIFEMQIPMAFNVISAPKFCPPGYRMDSNGKCRKIM